MEEKMKGVVVTTDGVVSVQEFDEPLYQTVGKTVSGYIEIVHPMMLKRPFVMIVNDEGRLEELDENLVGSYLYGTFAHGEPIVGDIVLMKEGFRDGEPDIVGLTDFEAESLLRWLELISKSRRAEA